MRPQLSIDTSKQGFDHAVEHALLGAEADTKLRWICEPTAMSWFPLACYAKPRGQEVVRVKTQMSYDLRKFYNKHNHSDSLDAKALAQLPVVHGEAMQEVYLPDKDTFALDRRTRQQKKIAQRIASIKSRIRDFYTWVQPGLSKAFTDPFCTRARAYYRHFTNPFKVKELGLTGTFAVAAISKKDESRGETADKIYLPGRSNPINFVKNDAALFLLQQVRDEAHRLAVGYQNKRRRKAALVSVLDQVSGIGKKRKKRLLSHFGTMKKIGSADIEELTELPGITTEMFPPAPAPLWQSCSVLFALLRSV